MSHALVLNATFEPLQIVPWQKALQLLFQGKVEVIEESNQIIRTVRFSFRVPAVLRLLTYVPLQKKKTWVRFSRSNVFLRDGFKCQYCGNAFAKSQLTLDHVIPVVQGGKKTWSNIVTACLKCNQRKGGRTPAEAGMSLTRKPQVPLSLPTTVLEFGLSVADERWRVYFQFETDKGKS